jgi:replicative DNA helicase
MDPSWFYDPLHQRIIKTSLRLMADGEPCTVDAVHRVMQDDPGLVETGGRAYLSALHASAPTQLHAMKANHALETLRLMAFFRSPLN